MDSQGEANWMRWAILGIGLSVVWATYLALFGPSVDSVDRLSPPTLVGTGSKNLIDWTWTVRSLDEQPVSFDRFRGKTVVLNLWASWCGPCRMEMPSLAKLADNPELKAKGVEVVCVSTDESPEMLKRFLAQQPWKLTMFRATGLPSAFLTDAIPATFVIAPDGQIAATELGAARWDDPAVIAFLTRLARPGS